MEFFLTWYELHRCKLLFCMMGINFLQTGLLCFVLDKFDYTFEHDYNWFIRWATCAAAEREIFIKSSISLYVCIGVRILRCELSLLAGGHIVLTGGKTACSNVIQSKSSTERSKLFHLPYFRHLKMRWITSWKCVYLSMECTVSWTAVTCMSREKNPSSTIAFYYCGKLLWVLHVNNCIYAIDTNCYNSYYKLTTVPPSKSPSSQDLLLYPSLVVICASPKQDLYHILTSFLPAGSHLPANKWTSYI